MSKLELSRSAIFELLLDRPKIKASHKIALMVMIQNSDWKTGHVQICRTAIKNKVGCSLNTLDKILKQFELDTVVKVHREFCEKKKAFKPNNYWISVMGLARLLGVTPGEIQHIKGKRTPKKKKTKSNRVPQKLSEGVPQDLSEGVPQKLSKGSLKNGGTLTQKLGEGSLKNEDIIPVYEPVSLPVNKPVIDNANTNKTHMNKPDFSFPRVTYDPIAAGRKKAEIARAKANTIKRERRR
tara:strand:- start:7 stop:723 length:717 start_codon:yes stop_codon:yes gene_type:complete